MENEELDNLNISAASALLGVPAPTIRSWERRYGIAQPDRTSGAHRRYDIGALTELRDFRDAIATGKQPKDAALLVKRRLEDRHRNSEYIDGILSSSQALEPEGIRRWLELAEQRHGLSKAIDQVVLPVLREIGSRWEAGRCDVANEHIASQQIRSWLAVQSADARPSQTKPVALLACGPKDLHTIGLEALSVMMAKRGWDCRFLGAMTPTRSAVKAASDTGASIAVVSSHMTTARKAAISTIEALDAAGLNVFYGGNAFSSERTRAGLPGSYLGESLYEAVEILESRIPS
jgi:methanogenic corrinoid protein MtbC1